MALMLSKMILFGLHSIEEKGYTVVWYKH